MQISQQNQMGESQLNKPLYVMFKIGENRITEKGCKYISKAQWQRLQMINFSFFFSTSAGNKIGDRGCQHFFSGSWP